MSALKVGDRVRATCGKSAIEGIVGTVWSSEFSVRVDGDATQTGSRYFLFADWTVEILPPPIPDVVGTILRDRDGDAWQRHETGWCMTSDISRFSFDEIQTYAPLTVLWTPGNAT